MKKNIARPRRVIRIGMSKKYSWAASFTFDGELRGWRAHVFALRCL
jgi:hypothetical protein